MNVLKKHNNFSNLLAKARGLKIKNNADILFVNKLSEEIFSELYTLKKHFRDQIIKETKINFKKIERKLAEEELVIGALFLLIEKITQYIQVSIG